MENQYDRTANSQSDSLVCFNKWLTDIGVTSTTGWRWRKRGIIQTTNIYGRLYVSESAIASFVAKAKAGEFAKNLIPGRARSELQYRGGTL